MKKHQVVTISAGAVTLLLLAASAIMLNRALSRTREMADLRDSKFEELAAIYRAPVFPEQKNVALIRQQMEEVTTWTSNVVTAQRAVVQVNTQLTPSQFMQVLQPAVRELARLKTAGGTKVFPDSFAFGFDSYITGGQMPAAEDIPKLALQWELTKRLCHEVAAANVSAIQSVTRYAFEGVAARAQETETEEVRGRRGRIRASEAVSTAMSTTEPRALTGLHPFTIEFTARKDALLAVLNRLAATDLFVMVNQVTVRKSGLDVKQRPDKWQEFTSLPQPQRVVSGPEVDPPLVVRLMLDVEIF